MPWQAAWKYCNDIVALRQTVAVPLASEPEIARIPDTFLSRIRNRIDSNALVAPGFDFDENREITLAGNDVDLAKLGAIAKSGDAVALHQ